jgi:hypothetical protein
LEMVFYTSYSYLLQMNELSQKIHFYILAAFISTRLKQPRALFQRKMGQIWRVGRRMWDPVQDCFLKNKCTLELQNNCDFLPPENAYYPVL